MFVCFSRNYNLVDGNNRAYILSHKEFEEVKSLKNKRTFRPETVKIIVLKEETPRSVLMTIAAGATCDLNFYNTLVWFKFENRLSWDIIEIKGEIADMMSEFIENYFCRKERRGADWICTIELLQQHHDY